MKTKLYTIFILSGCLIILALEISFFAGIFFVNASLNIRLVAALIIAILGFLTVFLATFSLHKFLILPLGSLENKIKEYVKIDASCVGDDPIGSIHRICAQMKEGRDGFVLRADLMHNFQASLFQALTTNDLIRALAEGLKALPCIGASIAVFINREKNSLSFFPIFPEAITEKREIVAKPDMLNIKSSAYRDNLSSAGNLNELEKIFLEKGYSSSFVAPITNGRSFLGVLGVALKVKEAREDFVLIEDMARLLGLKLASMELANKIKQKEEELFELKHAEKGKIDKLLTEIKSTYAQVVQAGKMAALGQLSAGVAHELNNPLGGILGYIQLVIQKLKKQDVGKEDIESSLKYLEMVEKESKRCQWIISNLLNFTRKPLDTRVPVSVEEVIQNTVSMMEYHLEGDKIKTEISFPHEGLKKVNANANELQQVFTNLIQNSIDVMPQGGRIAITGKNILDERFTPPAEYIELRFTDTGVGISKENLSRIFDPFFTSKIGKAGTGLGLAISYTIINLHKGLLRVESEEGKGTTFIIELPVTKDLE